MMFDEKVLIDLLGKRLYDGLFTFFREFYDRKSDYKIIMARRFFALYKIFKPVLAKKGIENRYGTIITNQALFLHKNQIKKSLENSVNNQQVSVIIADDMIIYGRTISNLIEQLLSFCNQDDRKEILKNIIVMSYARNVSFSKVPEEYNSQILTYNYTTQLNWKKYSDAFSLIVQALPVANTSYISSLKLTDNHTEIIKDLKTYCKKYGANITTDKLQAYDVNAYFLDAAVDIDDNITSKIELSGIRVYFYEKFHTALLSPLVIPKQLCDRELMYIADTLLGESDIEQTPVFYNIFNSVEDGYNSTKIRLLILLLSHRLLMRFLNSQNYTTLKLSEFDYKEILSYNFNDKVVEDFETYTSSIIDYTNGEYMINNRSEYTLELKEIKKFVFKQAMYDNRCALNGDYERKDAFLISHIFKELREKKIPEIIHLIDNSFAAIKSFFNSEGYYVSLVYSGEQAYRIMYDKFRTYMVAFNELENLSILLREDAYLLYRKFIEFLCKKGIINNDTEKVELISYIGILEQNNQEIGDVYVEEEAIRNLVIDNALESFIAEEVCNSGSSTRN